MVQNALQEKGQPKRKIGEMTAEGRRRQIQYKLGHGIRGVSPVLLGVERTRPRIGTMKRNTLLVPNFKPTGMHPTWLSNGRCGCFCPSS